MLKIIVDANLCRDCQACMLACSLYHSGESNPGLSRVMVTKDLGHYTFSIAVCQMCVQPDCLDACPSAALVMDECGLVRFIYGDCLDCGACAQACPYAAIFHDPRSGRFFKCELCSERAEGPLCVELCPVGVLTVQEV